MKNVVGQCNKFKSETFNQLKEKVGSNGEGMPRAFCVITCGVTCDANGVWR